MRIIPKEIMFGQPILKVREVARQAMQERLWGKTESAILEKVSRILSQPEAIAKQVIEAMVLEGYINLEKRKVGRETQYQISVSEKGSRFANATATPPISREKATELLHELIDKVKLVNSDDELTYCVQSVKVFGSYLAGKETLSDIDVGIKLCRRNEGDAFMRQNEKRIELAKRNGRVFSGYIDQLYWPYKEIFQMLKTRRRGLSLHDEDKDEVLNLTDYKLIYEYKK